MIRSMTGFGRGERRTRALQVTADARSVNHRFLDVRIKLPAEAGDLETELRRRVGRYIRRGRVEVAVTLQRDAGQARVQVDGDLVRGYLAAARAIQRETGVPGDVQLSMMLQLPGAVKVDSSRAVLTGRESGAIARAVDDALKALDGMRRREGEALGRDLTKRLRLIRTSAGKIRRRAAGLGDRKAERLRRRVRELAGGVDVDPGRLAQEVALLADRADIEEELVRLETHLDAMAALVARTKKAPTGKELDFLTQELHRETNTIHSKAGDLAITQGALAIKAEIEKIREQVQNIE
ncbi:MAG: YicC/YloC family endoribonuclease [Acidobacteriota bacterium]|jgi:uncharacterized protein (TIGR00255 family)